jgi:hypothetical protein
LTGPLEQTGPKKAVIQQTEDGRISLVVFHGQGKSYIASKKWETQGAEFAQVVVVFTSARS